MVLVCGIDEAGRGPVLGPLVLCGLVVEESDQQVLKELGAKDSKLLSAKQREALVDKILSVAKSHKLVVVEPAEIDSAVRGENGSNLNWLEADKAVIIIDSLHPDVVYLDCPSTNIPAYTDYILSRLKHKTKLICAHHADRDYPVVSGASILAKVERDRLVDEIKKKVGVDFGSGYAHDPLTKVFLEKCWNKHPAIFRHSWSSYARQVTGLKQGKLSDF